MRSALLRSVLVLAALCALPHAARAEPPADGADAAAAAETPPLSFQIAEIGPRQPWALQITNQSERPVLLVADPSLLWFEVQVPGKKKPQECRLPGQLFPHRARRQAKVVLGPGDAVSHVFDPRWYCFADDGQWRLVPGAFITPHFGWPEKTKTTWKKGKPVKVKAKQKPPYVAQVIEAAPAGESTTPGDTDAGPQATGQAMKQLTGNSFSLPSEYSAWSRSRLPDAEEDEERRPFEFKLTKGSDAQAERTATISVAVRNRGKQTQYLYLRRELISFEVMGPDGLVTCDPEPDQRAPDRQAFYRMTPGRTVTFGSRLVELCPRGTFKRPGLYLIHARLDSTQGGDDFELEAFVGRIVSRKPVSVRIRTGENPTMNRIPRMRRVGEAPESSEDEE